MSNKHDYKVEKVKEYKYIKFNSSRTEYKIYSDVDIFQVHNAVTELVNKMTTGLPDNVKLQISLENDKNDEVNQTKLLNKTFMVARLADWVILFIDYQDMEIEDIAIKLLKIDIPTGSGRRVNKIITVNSKCSIIKIRNNDTICLARAIVVRLAVQNREKLPDTFRSNLTEDELKQINTRSSAIADGPRDASCQLKSCQLPRNSVETTCTTSPDHIDVMKLEV